MGWTPNLPVSACLHALPCGLGYSVGRCPPCGARHAKRGHLSAGLRLRQLTPVPALRACWPGSGRPTQHPQAGLPPAAERWPRFARRAGAMPPTPNRNRWGDCCHWRDGLQVIAGQCLGLLVASWRLPPPPAAPAGAGLPQGYALDACTPPASGRLPLHDTTYRVIPR